MLVLRVGRLLRLLRVGIAQKRRVGAERARKLVAVTQSNPDIHLLMLMDAAGTAVVSSDPQVMGKNFRFREYFKVAIQGEPHCRTFFVECQVSLLNEKTQGQGASRRIAEQVAAASALIALGVENGHD